ncbi:uncharacterized protein LOC122087928 [Macadamia integrifolia]|uniref:uncharacterized protein LOC122087928 n=1 Tax=Macadamia integrifolia TaxID=60698 RepID=UPI001C4F13F9|nr:uncharacterized protein LOC122087928 [Macadamia integrifolia]
MANNYLLKREMGDMSSARSLALVAFVMAGIIISSDVVSAQFCQDDYKSIMMQCPGNIEKPGPKTPPSGECCYVMKRADIPCVCWLINYYKDVRQRISNAKVVYVAQQCGITLNPGIKCGS